MIHLSKEYYYASETKHLKALCGEKGINLRQSHRALMDVTLLYALLKRFNQKEFNDIVESANTVRYKYKIECSFDNKQLAKDIGGIWSAANKRWEIELTKQEHSNLSIKIQGDLNLKSKLSLTQLTFDI
jgi:DNA polymerase III epsilon subunit-like protein